MSRTWLLSSSISFLAGQKRGESMTQFPARLRRHIVPTMMFLAGIILGQIIVSLQPSLLHLAPQFESKELWGESQGPKLVLITTYMRSGSSLTGNILQQLPGAFYVFEPLFHLQFPKGFAFLNGTKIDWNDTLPGEDEYERQLEAWFRCDLEGVAPYDSFLSSGDQTKQFQHCRAANETDYVWRCLPDLIESCKRSKVIVIKTIRLKLEVAVRLAAKLPNLHLLHLVRDPRAILTSRYRVDPGPEGNVTLATGRLCSAMLDDLDVAQTKGSALAPRYKLIRYEDIAMDPLSATEDMYGFLGERVPARVYGYVYSITQCGKAEEANYNTERENSQATAFAWRLKADPELLKEVQQSQQCRRLLLQTRYGLFEDPGSITNMSISSLL